MKFSKTILRTLCALIAFGLIENIIYAEESLYVISYMDNRELMSYVLPCQL